MNRFESSRADHPEDTWGRTSEVIAARSRKGTEMCMLLTSFRW
jgi:hypothetical protein